MTTLPNNLPQFVEERQHGSPSGISSFFVKIDDKWGLKCYDDDDIRDECFNRQAAAAEFGLGPQVGDTLSIDLPDGTVYAYVSEVADTEPFQYYIESSDNDVYYSYEDDYPVWELVADLEEHTGWEMTDIHPGNFGLIDGQLVCIDFGM